MDADGSIHSLWHHGKDYVLTPYRQTNRVGRSLLINMTSDQGERRKLSYYRLKYAVDHGIGYDEIPPEFHVMPTENGVEVATRTEHMAQSMKKVAKRRRNYRLRFIEDKINELEIMRRFYSNCSDCREVFEYIEQKKEMLCSHYAVKYCTSRRRAEEIYAIALEKMIDRIKDPNSQITELTVSMMGLMNKVRKQEQIKTNYEIAY